MAKESMKAREVKRAKLCAKYAEKRKALKAAGDYAALDKLPKNASQPLLSDRKTKGIHESVRHQQNPVQRDGFKGPHPWSSQGQLVETN